MEPQAKKRETHVVTNQRQGLTAAGEAESDLDMAYRLQLEEAMAASLSLQPPSSSNPGAAKGPPLPDADKDDELFELMTMQALELDRYHQELRDAEQSQAEMRHLAADLCRRVHDERFAREVSSMSKEEWDDWGDEFEKPFGAVGDDVKEEADEEPEPFRLYFKGMARDEWVDGKLVHLSAICVTVCDYSDNIVLKVQKPVIMPAGVSKEILEAKALIEGLNAVNSLGIKRVEVLCDYKVLYMHITGRWRVRQPRIAQVINPLQLLQKKLKTCKFYLVPRCQIRYVYQLAKDVMDSQILNKDGLKGSTSLKQTCNICLEDTNPCDMFEGDECGHKFCFTCMRQHVEVKLLHAMLPRCPHEDCNVRLTVETSRKFLSSKILGILAQRIKEASIPPEERIYCPYPKCSLLMSRSEAIHAEVDNPSKQRIVDSSGLRRCIKCDGLFCINCKVPWHNGVSCFNYKKANPYFRPEDAKLDTLARDKLWRQCMKCKNMVELAEGCFHITCRCGYEFCYTCGAEWKNKAATCACPLWDERYIVDDDDFSDDDYDDDDDDDDDYEDDYGIYPA